MSEELLSSDRLNISRSAEEEERRDALRARLRVALKDPRAQADLKADFLNVLSELGTGEDADTDGIADYMIVELMTGQDDSFAQTEEALLGVIESATGKSRDLCRGLLEEKLAAFGEGE